MDFSSEEKKRGIVIRISVIAFAIFFVLAILLGHFISSQAGLLLFVMAILAGSIPISVFEYLKYTKFRKMEEHFPTFLEDFSEAKKSGMMFPQAFLSISKTEYGSLSNEIRISAAQLSWYVPFPKVMKQLSIRVGGSRLMKQAFTIINEAYTSGGDVAETMSSLATNVNKIKQIEDERRSIMSEQVFVTYFIYILFIGILAGLYAVLIPMTSINTAGNMTADSPSMPVGGISIGQPTNYCGEMPTMCNIGEAIGFSEKGIYFKTLFFLMSTVQAICSGVIAGQIEEGNLIAGLKHVGILLFVDVLSFLIFF
ncbi:MAG: type II secretion system F family protein [Nanoarchaeota archaeon]|nr:type II secretion system F family protein [Nanoarchaeota archaeon]MBU4300404.1 type II secretion system F family protein [Nanoarchaeota archaeon]MBU4451356.1 type II secretion system F family protein [Nanoarchaeota archaeon]MCG2723759.1 type II secretion system F family protein [archaeon]